MRGRDLKAEAVRAGLALYVVAAEAGVNPNRLGQLLNERAPLTEREASRIAGAIMRLSANDRPAVAAGA
jgi:hypothetical protein